MHEDVKWLLGILFLFAVIWFASGGLNNPSSFNPFIRPLVPGEQSQTYGEDYFPVNNGNQGESSSGQNNSGGSVSSPESISQSLREAGLKAEEIKRQINALEAESHTSPLKGKLMIVGTGGASGTASGEYIVLRASDANKEKVLITGLRLTSAASGRGAGIPKGAYLPFQNTVNVEEPVYLAPGETAYIITSRSPLGMSFRLNKCTGFLSQYQSFNPGLPSRCPAPRSERLPPPYNQYDENCLDYIDTLPSCSVIVNPPANISPSCARYVTTEINYTKCVERHRNDLDFYDADWRIYLSRDEPLWKSRREYIFLIDKDKKTVDALTY